MTRFFIRNIPTLLILIVSHQNDWKIIGSTFDGFSGPRYHRSRKSWKSGPDDSVFHSKHTYTVNFHRFPSVRLKNYSVRFWRLFRASVPPEQEKLKMGPIWLDLAAETYPHFLGCNSYRSPSVRLTNVSVQFWGLFRSGHRRSRKSWKRGPYDSV